jgi:actin-related protein
MNSATLSLFSTGLSTGLVVESGHSLTSVVPVFEGYLVNHAI